MVDRQIRLFFFYFYFTILLLLVGCSNAQTSQLTAPEIITRSSERMTSLKGFEFVIERSGEPVFLDYDEIIAFRRAEGQFTSPDRVSAKVRVIAPGIVSDVQIISLTGVQWETNFLTGKWQETDPLYSFNPSLLFDPKTGIQSILANNLIDPVLLKDEELVEIPGKKLYAIEANLQGDQAYQLSLGLIDNDKLKVKIWIDKKTYDLHRILIIDPLNPGDNEDTTWQIDFWNFGTTFQIEKPDLTEN
jgi:outer membrane lipoprotein-sorting protein